MSRIVTFSATRARTPMTEFSMTEPRPITRAVADQAVLHRRAGDARAGQEPRPRENWAGFRGEIECGVLACQLDIGLVECAHGADVFPVPIKQVGLNAVAGDRLRQELMAKVGGGARFQ